MNHDHQDEMIDVWRFLRTRLGKSRACAAPEIAAATGLSIDELRAAVKNLRVNRIRIGYSRRRPVGYYIISSPTEALESTAVQHRAAVAMLSRECLLRAIPPEKLLSEIARELTPHPPVSSVPATEKQVRHLSHLILSSLISEEEADLVYRQIASPDFSKPEAHRLIDELRSAIEERATNRETSKRRRLDYHSHTHPETPKEKLEERDVALTRRNWREARRARAEQAGRDIFGE